MKRTLLIVNANSGSAQAVSCDELAQTLQTGGFDIVERVDIPANALPGREAIDAMLVEVVAILSGDGTVSCLCEQLAGWPGEILILPGGTMNLLSRRLHGELGLDELMPKLSARNMAASAISVVCVGKREVLTGVTIGPSTKWGEVREGIRQGNVAELAETVPEAWSETLAESGVWIEGHAEQCYAGIFVEPADHDTLTVTAFRANNLSDMIGHGIAWLRRDFREGPRDDLGAMRDVTISGDDSKTGMLIDGEVDECGLPLTCKAGTSSVRFLSI